ncbi:efflux RND transporter periplasmic adaptor subunit [Marinobacter sp.]|uniref:efflux RND transporter periplasmic adaptor subunit n=1 Tax=Marinobacter sp. TaxID=50741 RepID=UPI003561310D
MLSQNRSKSAKTGALIVVAAFLFAACSNDDKSSSSQGGPGGEQPPPEVRIETAEPTRVEVKEEYAGRARGAREVEVRARTQGILEERLYDEGELVREGDALFRIDRAPAEAAVQGAEARLQVARAELSQAQREWSRISSLYDRGAISERERDSARSALELARANQAVAEAGLAQAQLDLDYTEVTAPVSGATSLEDLPEGSLIQQGTLLTTIVQHNPIHVRFALPENDATIQRRAREAMAASGDEDSTLSAVLITVDGEAYEHEGTVDFTASTLDPRTGTVMARAVFPNEDYHIVPGQFVRVRIQLQTLEDVFTVPESAVGQGPEGARVFVVGDDNQVANRYITLGPVVDGRQVITDGLQSGDRVVISGMVALRDGVEVEVAGEDGEDENGQDGKGAE